MRVYHLHEKGSGYIVSGLSDGRTVEVRLDNGKWSVADSPERAYDSPDELLENLESRTYRPIDLEELSRSALNNNDALKLLVARFGAYLCHRCLLGRCDLCQGHNNMENCLCRDACHSNIEWAIEQAFERGVGRLKAMAK